MKTSSLLIGPGLVFLGSKHSSDTCSFCLPPTYNKCMGRKQGVAPYSQVQARYEVQDMCLVYRSSKKAGDRENWNIGVQETKWGKFLTMRPLELPRQTALNTGGTAPWLPDLPMRRPLFRHLSPSCAGNLLSCLERLSHPVHGLS